MRAAIYLRQSLDLYGDELAVSRQREDCEAIVKRRGWELAGEWVDNDTSASKRNVPRPGYQAMVKAFHAGGIDVVVCWDMDRLTRLPREMEDWIEWAETRGVKLVTLNDDTNLATPQGRLVARVKAGAARAEIEQKGLRQSRAQQQRAQQGRSPKGIRPFGLTLRGYIVEEEAATMRGIVEAFLKGASLRAICRQLDGEDQGIRVGPGSEAAPVKLERIARPSHTLAVERNERRRLEAVEDGRDPDSVKLSEVPSAQGWHPASITQLLRNPRLAGYSIYTDRTEAGIAEARAGKLSTHNRTAWYERIVRDEAGEPVRGQWQTVIDPETWWQVQEKLSDPARKSNRTGKTHRKNLGPSLFRCGECGETVRSHSGNRYRCVHGCGITRARGPVDDYVRAVVVCRLEQPDVGRLPAASEETGQVRQLQAEITKQRARIARAVHDYDEELLEAADLKRVREKAGARIAELEREATALASGAMVAPILQEADPAAAFMAADLDTQRQVIGLLMTVHLERGARGSRTFDPASVRITWL